jgi:transposase InsO family protein
LDIMGGFFLTSGAELKLVTGVDDHSRFLVIAAVVPRATGRAVCAAFAAALVEFGTPEEVLTDNGKQFTARFGRPRPATEVLFDRICRENGITHRLTAPRTPTTTGKIERFHQSLRRELLDDHPRVPGPAGGAGRDRRLADGLQHDPAAPVAGHGHPGLEVPARSRRRTAAAASRRFDRPRR